MKTLFGVHAQVSFTKLPHAVALPGADFLHERHFLLLGTSLMAIPVQIALATLQISNAALCRGGAHIDSLSSHAASMVRSV